MSDTNETSSAGIRAENGHGAGDEFRGEDFPMEPAEGLPPHLQSKEGDDESYESNVSDSEGDGESDEPPEDEVPDGTVLEPGYHIFEIATATPCKPDVLLAGLTRLGIADIRVDLSRSRSAAQLPLREHRFIANVTKRLELNQQNAVRWLFAQALDTDVTIDVTKFRLKLEAYDLKPRMLYEAIFIARARSQPTRQIVEEHLNEMGFMIHTLTCLRRDVRLPTSPGVSVALWFGLLEWDAPPSVITEEEPFYFESLIPRA